MPLIQHINEENKLTLNKLVDSDQIFYSELNEWYTPNAFRSFSIKFVVEGSIFYKVGHKEYKVNQGNFLLASKQSDVQAYFDSEEKVKSICIDICPSSVSNAFSLLSDPDNVEFHEYMNYPYFFENIYQVDNTEVGRKLQALFSMIIERSSDHISSYIDAEWFLSVVELIVFNEFHNYHSLKQLDFSKPSTKKEILKRLYLGKDYIDSYFIKTPMIKEVARECNLSEFHFFRNFKKAFGISPHQYVVRKKLEYASGLVKETKYKLNEIATLSGFCDLFTFSKAFKKYFGESPSCYRTRKSA